MGQHIGQRSVAKAAIFIIGEGLLIIASTVLFTLGYGAYQESLSVTVVPIAKIISFSLLCQASIYFCGLYNNMMQFGMFEQVIGLIQALAIAMIIMVTSSLMTGNSINPIIILLWLGTLLVPTSLWRYVIQKMSATDLFCQRAILLGTDQSAQEICNCAMPKDGHGAAGQISPGLKIMALASCEDDTCRIDISPNIIYTPIKDSKQLIPLAREHRTKDVIVSKSLMNTLSANEVYDLKHNGLRLSDAATVLESICGHRSPDDIDPDEIIFSKSFQRSFHRFFKRLGDFSISFLLLILLSPLMIVVTAGIMLSLKTRAIKQKPCLGFRKRLFNCFSFSNPTHPSKSNFQFKRIQALPQLWNVLKGNMSLVGPCPIGPDQAKKISRDWPIFDERFTVRPGITGWAQVNCGHDCLNHSVRQTIGYDLFYLKHMSLFLDIVVLFRAMRFFAPGARFAKGTS